MCFIKNFKTFIAQLGLVLLYYLASCYQIQLADGSISETPVIFDMYKTDKITI